MYRSKKIVKPLATMDPISSLDNHRMAVDMSDVELLEKVISISRPGDENLFNDAIIIGNLDIIKCLLKNGCKRYSDKYCLIRAINRGHLDVVRLLLAEGFILTDNVVERICELGKLSFLMLLKEVSYPFDKETFKNIVFTGDIECIMYLIENKCPYGFRTLGYICSMGDLKLLEVLYKQCKYVDDALLDDSIYHYASDLSILKYLYEVMRIQEWRDYDYVNAIQEGDIEMMKYLRDKECPMSEDTFNDALEEGNLEVIRFLHENDCPADSNLDLYSEYDEEVAQYYHDHIYHRNDCMNSCVYCFKAKMTVLRENWEMDEPKYQNYIQWLPREVLDTIEEVYKEGIEKVEVVILDGEKEEHYENYSESEEDY